MEDIKKIVSVKERIAKKNIELIVTEDLKIAVKIPDETTFISTSITPYQLGAFILEVMSGQANNGNKLEDKNAILIDKNGNKQSAFISITKGAGIIDRNEFLLWHTPAVINCSSIEIDNDVSYRLTAIQAMDFISQVKNISTMPEMNLISGMLKIYKNQENKVCVKLKKSKVVVLNEEDKAVLLRTLERWLSGQYFFDEKRKKNNNRNDNNKNKDVNGNGNKMYYTTRFNRNNLLFTGSPRPRIKINEQFMISSYADIAEIFLLLYNV